MVPFRRMKSKAYFNNSEEENDTDETGEEQRDDKCPMMSYYGALNEIPFAKKATGGRDADNGQGPDDKGCHCQWLALEKTIKAGNGMGFHAVGNNPGNGKKPNPSRSTCILVTMGAKE